jgi:hypothetical protein
MGGKITNIYRIWDILNETFRELSFHEWSCMAFRANDLCEDLKVAIFFCRWHKGSKEVGRSHIKFGLFSPFGFQEQVIELNSVYKISCQKFWAVFPVSIFEFWSWVSVFYGLALGHWFFCPPLILPTQQKKRDFRWCHQIAACFTFRSWKICWC